MNSFGAPVNGNQHLTRAEALRTFSRGNSWFLRMEDKLGSIEVGKLADLAVLDRDYFTVPDADIKKVRALLTSSTAASCTVGPCSGRRTESTS